MKGICFKEPLFHATIEGRKTQTRRIIKHAGNRLHYGRLLCDWPLSGVPEKMDDDSWEWELQTDVDDSASFRLASPRYEVGDIVYLKEPYYWAQQGYHIGKFMYKYDSVHYRDGGAWKNKLFMPESVARYFIKITAVRAERLQDISDEDCVREGLVFYEDPIGLSAEQVLITYGNFLNRLPRNAYAALIDQINGRGTWDSNPWVWVYDYELYNKKTNQ